MKTIIEVHSDKKNVVIEWNGKETQQRQQLNLI